MPVPFALEQQVAIAAVRRACALTTTVFNKLVTGETLVKGDKSPVTGTYALARIHINAEPPVLIEYSSPLPSPFLTNQPNNPKKKIDNEKVADYSAQAVVNTILSNAFPNDPIVGEEDAADLRARPVAAAAAAAAAAEQTRNEEIEALKARVVQLADDVLELPPFSSPSSLSTATASGLGVGLEEREEWGLGRRWGAEALLKAIDMGNHAGGRTGRAYSLARSFFFRRAF